LRTVLRKGKEKSKKFKRKDEQTKSIPPVEVETCMEAVREEITPTQVALGSGNFLHLLANLGQNSIVGLKHLLEQTRV
jgi:hypothetical protein